MKLTNPDNSTLMEIGALRREGNSLVISGTILESMPIMCVLTPREARSLFKLLNFKTFIFLTTFLFRR